MGFDEDTRRLELELARQEAMGISGCGCGWRGFLVWLLAIVAAILVISA